MRRMSATDIVITPDDRPGGVHRARHERVEGRPGFAARLARAATELRGEPKAEAKPKARRKSARSRLGLGLTLSRLQRLAAGGVALTALVVGGLVAWHSGAPQRAVRALGDSVLETTATAGFRVAEITVAGRLRTPTDAIVAALGVRHGDPILGVDLADAKDRLEAIASVRTAAVERRLPGTLHLAIVEREPVAIWQHDGEVALVDRDGHLIPGGIEGFEDLPLVVGDGAPMRADELLTMLATEPTLAPRVKAAVRVGNRRWNLRLDNSERGMEVRLPEDGATTAWHRLAELEGEHGLTAKQVVMIDMRVPDRLVFKTEKNEPVKAGEAPQKAERDPAAERHRDNGA